MAAMEAHVLHVGLRRFYTLCIIVLGQLRHEHVTQAGVRDYVDDWRWELSLFWWGTKVVWHPSQRPHNQH